MSSLPNPHMGIPRSDIHLTQDGPGSMRVSWNLASWVFDMVADYLRTDAGSIRLILRVNDVTGIIYDGRYAHMRNSIEAWGATGGWVFDNPTPGRDYLAEIGTTTFDGQFIPLASSQSLRLQ